MEDTIQENVHDIERCPHDRENPYAQISNELIRNKSVSPRCRWFIIYCLSLPRGWKLSIPQVMKDQEIGREVMYGIIDEAIESGYMKRISATIKGLKRFKYLISEEAKFKNILPYAGFPHAEKPHAVLPHTKEERESLSNLRLDKDKKKESKKGPGSALPSADAEVLYDFFVDLLKKRNPNLKEPNKSKWIKTLDLLLKNDKRDLEETKALLLWASDHKWWKTGCLSPESLRNKYDEMTIQKVVGKENSIASENRQYSMALKRQYPQQLKDLFIDSKGICNTKTSKDLSFNMKPDIFKRLLVQLFGGKINE